MINIHCALFQQISYEYLIVALGLQLHYEKVRQCFICTTLPYHRYNAPLLRNSVITS